MDASKLYEKAEDAVKRKNYDYAIDMLKNQILSIYPNDVKARKLLRGCENRRCQENGYPSKLQATLSGLVPSIKITLFKMLKKWEKVMEECENYLLIDPRSKGKLATLGEAAAQAGHLDTAISQYEELLGIDGNYVGAYAALGQLYEAKEELAKALEYYQRAIKLNPADGDSSRKVKGISARMTAADYGQAKSSRDLIKDKDKARALAVDEKKLHSIEDYEEAIGIEKKSLESTGDKRHMRKLGELYQGIQKWKEAIEYFEQWVKADPTSFDATVALSDCRVAEMQEKINKYKQKAEAGDGEAKKKAKAATEKLNAFKIEEYERRVKSHPTDLGLRFSLGMTLFNTGQVDAAIEHLQKSTKDPRHKMNSYDLLGQAFLKQGENGLAINQFQKALEGVSKSDDRGKRIRYLLGNAYEQGGEKDKAKEIYEEIMEQDINYKDVRDRVKNLRD